MTINGLKLPSLFVEIIHKGILQRRIGSWQLRNDVDAFGNHLESELGQIYETTNKIVLETNNLPKNFASIHYETPDEWQNESGYLPYITDFSKIVCFGMSGDGAPFCFDFRDNLEKPSVIWWADAYWRLIAPDFGSFVALLNLEKSI